MYPELGENLTQGYFTSQNVLVTLGQLWKKVSNFILNYCRLEFKEQMLLITDEKRKYIFQLAKVRKQVICKRS